MGFLDPEIALIAFIPFGIFSSVMGSAGYVMSLIFYSPAVVTNSYLLEPFIAQMMGYYFKIDEKPGALTIFGTILTLYGVYKIDETAKTKKAIRKIRPDMSDFSQLELENFDDE